MLATFVIGLREGLEAALIVGIIAAFLTREGRREALRWVALGVLLAIAICLAVAIGLELWSTTLPDTQQETLEAILGAFAVVVVTSMIVWMRSHARSMKRELEGAAASALAAGAVSTLVVMAFLAVLREGFETAVFLLAALKASASADTAGIGALLGIVVAILIGYGIFRGGVRINLARFFRLTGLVLVLVAGGLVASSLHAAAEAGWLTIGQAAVADLSWLIQPDSIQAALLTNVLGLQAEPTVIEILGWLAYVIPVGLFVLWPQGAPARPAPAASGAG